MGVHFHRSIHNGPGNIVYIHNYLSIRLSVLRVLCGFHLVRPPSTFNVSVAAAWAAARRAVSTRKGEQET